jgi:hypothetical protein
MANPKKGDAVWLHLDNEIKALGSGRRRVIINRFGWKNVSVSCSYKKQAINIPRFVWDKLKKVEVTHA